MCCIFLHLCMTCTQFKTPFINYWLILSSMFKDLVHTHIHILCLWCTHTYVSCQQHVHSSHVGLKEKVVVVTSRSEEAAAPVKTPEAEPTPQGTKYDQYTHNVPHIFIIHTHHQGNCNSGSISRISKRHTGPSAQRCCVYCKHISPGGIDLKWQIWAYISICFDKT